MSKLFTTSAHRQSLEAFKANAASVSSEKITGGAMDGCHKPVTR